MSSADSIYISYSWKAEKENGLVAKMMSVFAECGIDSHKKPKRDLDEIDYGDSIRAYMDKLASGGAIILVLSEPYFKSPNCMYELREMYLNDRKEFRRRIFPVVLQGTRFHRAIDRIPYISFWEEETKQLEAALASVSRENVGGSSHQEFRDYAAFRNMIDDLQALIGDMNHLTEEDHLKNDFSDLIERIVSASTSSWRTEEPDALLSPVADPPETPSVSSASSFVPVELHILPDGGFVNSVFFSPDGRFLASVSFAEIQLWDVVTRKRLRRLEGHTKSGIYSVAFSSDGTLLASGGYDKTVRLWNSATGEMLHTLKGHTDTVKSVAFSPDGRLLVSGGYKKPMLLWNVASGKQVGVLKGQWWDNYWWGNLSVIFSPCGRLLASGALNKTVRLWDAAAGKLLRTLKGHTNSVRGVAFSPDSRLLASGADDKTIRLWEVTTGNLLYTLEKHAGHVNSVAFSPDGRLLISGASDNTIQIWNPVTGKLLYTLWGHTGSVCSVACSSDSCLLGSGSLDRTIRIWRLR